MNIKIEEESDEKLLKNRLGICENCGLHEAKYTCPRCEFRSCCLECVNFHKKEFNCNGIRDKTRFKTVSEFTDLDLLSDYRLLEEAGRCVETYHRDESRKHSRINRELPLHLHRLRCQAAQRGVTLRFLPSNFARHKYNSTFLNWKTKKIDWKIEWRFSWTEEKIINTRVPEDNSLSSVYQGVLESDTKAVTSAGSKLDEIHIFMAAEHTPGQNGRFHLITLDKTLAENLKGTIVVEHPIFHVVLDPQDRYPLIGSPLTEEELAKKRSSARCEKKKSSTEKKQKLTFFELSDGELSEND